MSLEVVIGIEIHCELKTNTKMFSGAMIKFGSAPNTNVNEVDLAHPGTLPCINKKAVELALRAATCLNLEIDPLLRFDRKNYYYSDLPKGYQITQQYHPIGKNGYIEIDVAGKSKKIRINRLHMEEDTAKQFHEGENTLIDFNRAGTPLVEIVSEPDIRSAKEAVAYIDELRSILLYTEVSDCKMEEGSLRCDINISLRPCGSTQFGVKTEIKNLNSTSNVEKAIEYEIERQTKLLLSGEEVIQETRRYDEASKQTVTMRKKEGAIDYKYFCEPNIFPIKLDLEYIKQVQAQIPMLARQRYDKYVNEYGLSSVDAKILVQTKQLSDFYDSVIEHTKLYKLACNWTLSDVLAALNKLNLSISDNVIDPKSLAVIIELTNKKELSSSLARVVFEEVLKGKDPIKVIEEKGLKQNSDPEAVLKFVTEVLDANPQSIEDYKNGKDRAVKFLVGQIMKNSKGQVNPVLANSVLLEELKKR